VNTNAEKHEFHLAMWLQVRQLLADDNLYPYKSKVTSAYDHFSKHVAAEFSALFLCGKPHISEHGILQFPADWWQAVRERWCPQWWLRRHPVKRTRRTVYMTVYNTCPHLNIGDGRWEDQQHHIDFLTANPVTDPNHLELDP
jgi:hypothetical protein